MLFEYKLSFGHRWDDGGEADETIYSKYICKYIKEEIKGEKVSLYHDNSDQIITYVSFLTRIYNSALGKIIRTYNYLKPQNDICCEKEQFLKGILVLYAAAIATMALQQQVQATSWIDIIREINNSFSKLKIRPGLDGAICLIYDAISRVNNNAAVQWRKVYHISLRAMEY